MKEKQQQQKNKLKMQLSRLKSAKTNHAYSVNINVLKAIYSFYEAMRIARSLHVKIDCILY